MNRYSDRTEARRRVAVLYPREIIRRMRGFIDHGPGFVDDDARKVFPSRLWAWACDEMIWAQYKYKPRPKGAGDQLRKFYKALQSAVICWGAMPEDARHWVAMAWPKAQHDPTGDPNAADEAFRARTGAAVDQIALALDFAQAGRGRCGNGIFGLAQSTAPGNLRAGAIGLCVDRRHRQEANPNGRCERQSKGRRLHGFCVRGYAADVS